MPRASNQRIPHPLAVYKDEDIHSYRIQYQMSNVAMRVMGCESGVRQGNEHVNQLAQDAFKPVSFSGTTRWQKFGAAFTGCARRGVNIGARAGQAVMSLPDAMLGTGIPTAASRANYDPQAEGLVGLAAHLAVDVTSTVAMVPGAAAGVTGAVLVSPIALGTKLIVEGENGLTGPIRDNYGTTANRYGNFVGRAAIYPADGLATIVAAPVAGSVGAAMGVARLSSVAAKYTFAGVGGLVGAIGGLFIGAGRAIFNS